MKHFNTFRVVLLLSFLTSLTSITSFADDSLDSVDIALLTCGPGQEVYSLYGHTAIRYVDHRTGEDLVVNYGMFSFQQHYFVLRFVFGLTDYQMGITPFDYFMGEYESEGRWVYQQMLALTPDQKKRIVDALARNYQPQNRTYRYNFFYNNCTTKARDMIVDNLGCAVEYPKCVLDGVTFRSMLHQWNDSYPWSRLGNDLLLGVNADRQVTRAERQFLPDSLRKDFDGAYVLPPSGGRRKLVSASSMLYAPSSEKTSGKETLSSILDNVVIPPVVATVWLAVIALVALVEKRIRKIFWGVDAFFLSVLGVAGLILTAMIFSKHPAVSLNFQIFLLSPLFLVALWPTVKGLRRHHFSKWIYIIGISVLLFLFLGIWQKYDAMMCVLALSLLFRIAVLYNWCRNFKEKTV